MDVVLKVVKQINGTLNLISTKMKKQNCADPNDRHHHFHQSGHIFGALPFQPIMQDTLKLCSTDREVGLDLQGILTKQHSSKTQMQTDEQKDA